MTTQQDDFLAQILATETKAEQIIQDAKARGQSTLLKLEKDLSKEREKKLSLAKESAKGKLSEKQVIAKGIYEDLLKEGKKEATLLKKESEKRSETILSSAESFFINEII